MSKRSRGRAPRRKGWGPLPWVAGLAVIALAVYGLSQTSSVAYGEDAIRVINFSGLNADDKQNVLEDANRARCDCGCGMTLAQCVATDSTCPVREQNIDLIRTMVREADGGAP